MSSRIAPNSTENHWVITRRPGRWTIYPVDHSDLERTKREKRTMCGAEGRFLTEGADQFRHDWHGTTTWHLPWRWEPAGVGTV